MTEEKALTRESKLREGISILYDMELNGYLVQRGINQLNTKIDSLGHPKNIYKPALKDSSFDFWEHVIPCAGIIACIGAVIGGIYELCVEHGFFNKLFGIIGGVIVFGPIFGIIGFVIGIISAIIIIRKDKNKREAEFVEETEAYNQKLEKDKKRVSAELKQKKRLENEREELLIKSLAIQTNLEQFYECMGIDKKFQNIVPIAYMNEFISLGISNKLEGTDGLYYLIMHELRMDQMQYTLNEICSKLDKIVDHLHALYGDLNEMNRKCDRLISTTIKQAESAKITAENSAIAAYNSERTARELEFQNFMIAYSMM